MVRLQIGQEAGFWNSVANKLAGSGVKCAMCMVTPNNLAKIPIFGSFLTHPRCLQIFEVNKQALISAVFPLYRDNDTQDLFRPTKTSMACRKVRGVVCECRLRWRPRWLLGADSKALVRNRRP
jgi:hypothetical protein